MALFLYYLCLVLTLLLLKFNQTRSNFIRPGWFFNIISFFYYGFPLSFTKINPDFIYYNFNRIITNEFYDYMVLVLLIAQIAFLVSELISSKLLNDKKLTPKITPIRNSYIYFLLIISYILFFYRWSIVGGYFSILELSRTDYINEVAENRAFNRYDITLNVATLFISINSALIKEYIKNNKLMIVLYLGLVLLLFLMGTRLLIVNYIISFFCIHFFLNKSYLIKNRNKILSSIIIFFLIMVSYQTIRKDVQEYFATNKFEITTENLTLVPFEFYTGILSEHSLEHGITPNYNISYFQRLIPQTIKPILGIKDYERYAVSIARHSHYTSGRIVYTIPFIFDVFHGSGNNFFVFFIYIVLIYTAFYLFFEWFRLKHILFGLCLYPLMYNVLRVEGPIWFSKIYLTFFLLFLLLLYNKLRLKIKK